MKRKRHVLTMDANTMDQIIIDILSRRLDTKKSMLRQIVRLYFKRTATEQEQKELDTRYIEAIVNV